MKMPAKKTGEVMKRASASQSALKKQPLNSSSTLD